jgi:ubiquinone biosynthesis protein
MKYGRSDLVKTTGLEEALEAEQRVAPQEAAKAEELAKDLEKLGPTFVKLGQLLSTRVELMPKAYLDALSRLQDKVEPFGFDEVEKIVSSEIGVRLSKAFSDFEVQPLVSASLGQVHRAVLRSGQRVAVKVQRPGIRETMVEDLEALDEIAAFLDNHTEFGKRYEFQQMLEQFRKSVLRELDYREEASNLITLRAQLANFDRLIVPVPIADYSTARVLTMEHVHGRKSARPDGIRWRRARRTNVPRLSRANSRTRIFSCRSASGKYFYHRRLPHRLDRSWDGGTDHAAVAGGVVATAARDRRRPRRRSCRHCD